MAKNPKAKAVMDALIQDVKKDPSILLAPHAPMTLDDVRRFVDETWMLDGSRRKVKFVNGRLEIGPLSKKEKQCR